VHARPPQSSEALLSAPCPGVPVCRAYQVAFSISAVEFQRRTGRTERLFTLALDSDRFAAVAATLSGAGVHPRDQSLELERTKDIPVTHKSHAFWPRYDPGIRCRSKYGSKRAPQSFHPAALVSDRTGHGDGLDCFLCSEHRHACVLPGSGLLRRCRSPTRSAGLAGSFDAEPCADRHGVGLRYGVPLLLWPDIVRPTAIFFTPCASPPGRFGFFSSKLFSGASRNRPALAMDEVAMCPIGFSALGTAVAFAGTAENFRVVSRFPALLARLDKVTFYLSRAAISSSFGAYGRKSNGPPQWMLGAGSFCWSMARASRSAPSSSWSVFPITLAYVIVVQRALDVRVVIRQGTPICTSETGNAGPATHGVRRRHRGVLHAGD
jgi:hypothetical protein